MLSYNVNIDSAAWVDSVHGIDLMFFLERIGKDLSKCLITAQPCVRLSYSPHRCRAGERHCPPGNWRKTYKAATQGTGKSCAKVPETMRLPVTQSAEVCRRVCTPCGCNLVQELPNAYRKSARDCHNTGDGSMCCPIMLTLILPHGLTLCMAMI